MSYYTKINRTPFSDSLIKEAQGLNALRQYAGGGNLRVVEVFDVDEHQLKLTAVEAVAATNEHWVQLAKGLADLHNHCHSWYGYENDNYIGLNPQVNETSQDWGAFFVDNRLRYQIEIVASTALRRQFSAALNEAASILTTFLRENCAHPSPLHGDLWAGNVLFSADGQVWLIDPAMYYGDAEADLAMTEMFGGFSSVFYENYTWLRPLSDTYGAKKIIYNLYHQLNHFNLFGDSYLPACEKGMEFLGQL